MGVVLYDTETKNFPFEKDTTLWHDSYPDSHPKALEIHGITKKECHEFGVHPSEVIERLAFWVDEHKIDYLVAHNGNEFDFPMLIQASENFCASLYNFWRNKPKIDTKTDIVYPPRIETRKLSHLAAEHGFLNPFPHSTLSDIRTMFKILLEYPLDSVIERSRSPVFLYQGLVEYEKRDAAKACRFFWDAPTKRWLKKIKDCDFMAEQKACLSYGFDIQKLMEGK